MKFRLVILTELIAPYRIPVFNALSKISGIDLHVIFLAENDPGLRQWLIYKNEIEFSYQTLPSTRLRVAGRNILLNRGLQPALAAAAPHAVVCGGYNYLASWQARTWAKANHVSFLLWIESTGRDQRSNRLVIEFLKNKFIHDCDAFVVPGTSSSEYLQSFGVRPARIFAAPNAVDNGRFHHIAEDARRNAEGIREELGLPARYFLFCGRLVAEKGVFDLLDAYRRLGRSARETTGLVFVGDGPASRALQQTAADLQNVRFLGFQQRDQLARIMSLATALILPTHSDTWGLVVNEAMACGLPVVVSEVAGCAADLVRHGWNGFIVKPHDRCELIGALESLMHGQEATLHMGQNSLLHIHNFSAEACAAGLANAALAFKESAACA